VFAVLGSIEELQKGAEVRLSFMKKSTGKIGGLEPAISQDAAVTAKLGRSPVELDLPGGLNDRQTVTKADQIDFSRTQKAGHS
jgi:hypothetical protein